MLKQLENGELNKNSITKDFLATPSNKKNYNRIYNSVIQYSKNLFKRKKFFQQIILNNIEAVRIILKDDNKLLYAYCGRGQTGLMKACEIGSAKMVKLLIEYGAKDFINLRDYQFGNTALHYACQNGNVNMVDLLVKNGADFEIQDNDGMNSFHTAYEFNNDYLINHIQNLYIKNSNLQNSLYVKDKRNYDCFKIKNTHFQPESI